MVQRIEDGRVGGEAERADVEVVGEFSLSQAIREASTQLDLRWGDDQVAVVEARLREFAQSANRVVYPLVTDYHGLPVSSMYDSADLRAARTQARMMQFGRINEALESIGLVTCQEHPLDIGDSLVFVWNYRGINSGGMEESPDPMLFELGRVVEELERGDGLQVVSLPIGEVSHGDANFGPVQSRFVSLAAQSRYLDRQNSFFLPVPQGESEA